MYGGPGKPMGKGSGQGEKGSQWRELGSGKMGWGKRANWANLGFIDLTKQL